MTSLWLLLLPIAAASGWFMGRNDDSDESSTQSSPLHHDYMVGLNYLLEEQPDKAVDVFIKMIEVDSKTVETHLALGSLFRRRGEVDRAIRIHQNLIARPNLNKQHQVQALMALGLDYMGAGVFDRAERIFKEVIDLDRQNVRAYNHLLAIFEQEKSWQQAIEVARQFEKATSTDKHAEIAHYYCELAEADYDEDKLEGARDALKFALKYDNQCVRARLLQARLACYSGHYKQALNALKEIVFTDPDFLSLALEPILECHERLGNETSLDEFLRDSLEKHPRITIILTLADRIYRKDGTAMAVHFITEQMQKHPSLGGLNQLIAWQSELSQGNEQQTWQIVGALIEKVLAERPVYRCVHCGIGGKQLNWHCPGCKRWNTVKPIQGIQGE